MMGVFPLSTTIRTAVIVAASCLAVGEAFRQPAPTTSAASRLPRQNDDLLRRDALFGFGATAEKTTNLFKNSEPLVEKAEYFVDNQSGFYSTSDPDVFAEDFVFRGPFIGPLNKKDYLETMEAFGIPNAIPDISANAWGFSIDPEDQNRVWFMVRNTGTFEGGDNLAPGALNVKPTGDKIQGAPETFSIIFDEEQKVKYLSVGYVADRFDGNTNGKGAAVGIFNVIGIPFPPIGPLFRFSVWLGSVIGKPPLAFSTDVPEWYLKEKGTDICADGYI